MEVKRELSIVMGAVKSVNHKRPRPTTIDSKHEHSLPCGVGEYPKGNAIGLRSKTCHCTVLPGCSLPFFCVLCFLMLLELVPAVSKTPGVSSSGIASGTDWIDSSTNPSPQPTTQNTTQSTFDSMDQPSQKLHGHLDISKMRRKAKSPSKNTASNKRSTSTLSRRSKKATLSSSLSRDQTTSIRRIQREWKDIVQQGIAFDWKRGRPYKFRGPQHVYLGPISNNLWIWHFSFMGLPHSVFEDGIYHGRVILPPNYPARPPRVQVWTPSGRFQTRFDICLSASNYHPESWTPSAWSVRTIVESLRLHMITAAHEIGGTNDSYEDRKEYAVQSRAWKVRVRPDVLIDHERMLKDGYFSSLIKTEESDEASLTENANGLEIGDSNTKAELNSVADPKLSIQASRTTGNLASTVVQPEQDYQAMSLLPSLPLGLIRVLTSPIRLAFMTFLVFFYVLNR